MAKEITFRELGKEERILLLKAFNYNIDEKGFILNQNGEKVKSKENPSKFIEAKFASLLPGSLEIVDGTPTALAEYLVERESKNGN